MSGGSGRLDDFYCFDFEAKRWSQVSGTSQAERVARVIPCRDLRNILIEQFRSCSCFTCARLSCDATLRTPLALNHVHVVSGRVRKPLARGAREQRRGGVQGGATMEQPALVVLRMLSR